MTKCAVRWRPSGGRGEFEFVPSTALADRQITVRIDALGVDIPAEIRGTNSQGKPRLRKDEPNNRSKLHLVNLVTAVARLPDPAREDKTGTVSWPLEAKNFIVSEMGFDIASDDGDVVVLKPLTAKILHSEREIELRRRFQSIAEDIKALPDIKADFATLGAAIDAHAKAVAAGVNSDAIRKAAEAVIKEQVEKFGRTNTAAVTTIVSLPPTPFEDDISGKEGKVLTRLHWYRERDRKLVKKAKALFKHKHGSLFCECCGFRPGHFYGPRGEDRIQAHHKTPVEELLPDTETRPDDLAMVCANCHDVIHAKRPWLAVEELRDTVEMNGNSYFGKK